MSDKLRALLDWSVTLTLRPAACTEADVVKLRCVGWTDPQISAACFVVSYFNFINRVADGLGVDQDASMQNAPPLPPCPWTA